MHSIDLYLCKKNQKEHQNNSCGRRSYGWQELDYAYLFKVSVSFRGIEHKKEELINFGAIRWKMQFHTLPRHRITQMIMNDMFTALYEEILDSVDKEVG